MEYFSHPNSNTDFIDPDSLMIYQYWKLSQGLTSFNFKSQVASDINIKHNKFLPQGNFESQNHLNKLSEWTKAHLMKLNSDKSKFMVVNFTEKYQFKTRLNIKNVKASQRNKITWSHSQ